MHEHDVLDERDERDWREVLLRVVIELRVQQRAQRDQGRREYDGVPVGRRLRGELETEIAARAGAIVGNDLLPQLLGEFLRKRAPENVARAARREWQDQAHRFRRERLS